MACILVMGDNDESLNMGKRLLTNSYFCQARNKVLLNKC